MLFMNQDRIYGRRFRDESGGDGDAGGTPNPADGGGGDDIAAQLATLQAERDALLAKNNELLGETKKAKALRTEAERAAAEAARAKAEADGNYEQLFQSSEAERESLAAQLAEITKATQAEKVGTAALKIASNLAEGANVELLAEFVSRRLKFADDGVKVVDDNGNLTISSLEDLGKEIAGSAKFASLIKGNQSSGGGAAGGSNSSGAAQVINRAEFEALTQVARAKFISGGGKVTD